MEQISFMSAPSPLYERHLPSLHDGIPDTVMEKAAATAEELLLPQKSKGRYMDYLGQFEEWCRNLGLKKEHVEGRVMMASPWRLTGHLIVLDVGEDYLILLYGRMNILVEEGQKVTAGEPVASMAAGATELDLDVRKNGEPVNPTLWLSTNSVQELAIQPE